MKKRLLVLIFAAMTAMASAQSAAKIVANPASLVYHVRCNHVETCKKCTVQFQSEADAKAKGFHICPFAKKATK